MWRRKKTGADALMVVETSTRWHDITTGGGGEENRELGDTKRGAVVKTGRHGHRASGFETENHGVLTPRGRGEAN